MGNMGLGVLLMCVGMVVVFAILLIVIFGGELLIRIINKIAPETVKAASGEDGDPTVKAVLEQAVAQITGGKGHIVRITEIRK